MKAILAIVCVLLGTAICDPVLGKREKKSYRGHKLVSVKIKTPIEAEFMRELQNDPELNLDFWKQPMKGDVHIHVEPMVYEKFKKTMERAKMRVNVIEEDIQRLVDEEQPISVQSLAVNNYTNAYLTLDEIDTLLNDLEAEFPQRVQRFDLSQSTYEGKPLWAVKISTNLNGSGKKAIWVETGTHAREFITISVALGTIDNLARLYGGSSIEAQKATAMLDLYDWYFVPIHNPDGYFYAHNSERLWRKNRKRNNRRCYGVDLNRNWNADFGGAGSSGQSCSQTYRGKNALDQPETASLDLAVQNTNPVIAFISIHAYSQLILLPWGFTNTKPSDYNTLFNIGTTAKQELESYYNTQYLVGTPPDLLYAVSGGSTDHMKLIRGIKYSFAYELRPGSNSNNGFLLPVAQIPPTIEETFASLWKMAEQINIDDTQAGRK